MEYYHKSSLFHDIEEKVKGEKREKMELLKLIESSANKELPGIYPLISETLANGIFFDTLEIYLGIMKERIAPKRRN